MERLYIIGNGFDIAHKLPTTYADFFDSERELFDDIAWFYDFDDSDNPWCDFENALGDFCPESFLSYYNEVNVDDDNFRPRDIYGLEDEMAERASDIISSIQSAFYHWISKIDVSSAKKSLKIDIGSRFISFNYTSTLQSVYKICDTQVNHIHGSVNNHDELIFGHGRDPLIVPEFDEDGESLRGIFSDAEEHSRGPLNQLRKPVDEIIGRSEALFRSYETVSDIRVIGHSLNSIDLPYFNKIASYAKNATWTVYYYDEDEVPRARKALETCGIKTENKRFINIKKIEI